MTYPTLFALWTAQGILAFLWLIFLPSDSGSFSMGRWMLLGIALALGGFSALAWFRSRRWTQTPLQPAPVIHNILYILALLTALAAPLTILIFHVLGQATYTYAAYASRLAPLAAWFTLAGLEWLWLHRPNRQLPITNYQLRAFSVILAALVLTALLILATRWGLTPTRDGSFGHPATPFMEWQIFLGLLIALAAASILPRLPQNRLDLLTFLLVYLFTCLLWLSDPLLPGFFATSPRAPNFEPYPFSDALIYAQYAQQALVGGGLLWPDIPTRPLYVSSLVWMHALAGQDYYHVITLQTLWLACFPACLYLLGKELGSRPLGLMLALLAALRDVTTNHAAPFALNYTYSKLFFSETPTALLLIIFTILATRWIKSPKPGWYTLLMGGILGIAALVRLQSAVLLAPLAVVSIFPLWKTRRAEWIRSLACMTLGLALALAPWLTRNYFAADGLVVDNPISQSAVLAWRWGGIEETQIIPQQPGETTAQFTGRMTRLALENFRKHPQVILTGAANHFFNNLISSLHVFPVRDKLNAPNELIWPAHAFWQTGFRSVLLTIFYLLLFAVGLSAAWTSLRWIGLLPLALSLFYHAWTALFLSSGDRFLVPIDWSTYLYQAWGLLLLGGAAFSGIRGAGWYPAPINNHIASEDAGKLPSPRWQLTLTAAAILFIGASIPLSEVVFPLKYTSNANCQFALQSNEICLQGRAIYPRYYESGDGEPGTAKLGYAVSEQARLVFWLAGPQPGLVILPLESAPAFFPHAADVWIVGTKDGETMRARIVRVEMNGKTVIYTQD
jgi:hypothetical protein